ncbi:tRNA (N(6)-L-threonylcarbamoyladenosine(37)-C(2))-methylthiotransferase MtaB [Candidatus Stoquefichus massiliensis]|uniref:tRNA (N(6)-L-threonylcarbamoyladenosine(37)-C(2))- methylthiotransferase MtaB n=1 Tax=Candidatus Stoquefichus massiliensis TaxID=1470350 RepID=UPI0004810805|nr:tRNA (N(6)-L-threonylcarbamoyladenosine(37)-C(2))-methylthiotransferase MtaB [Candidatus Stoquefichus massiliensis]
MKTVAFLTLGCKVNTYESEAMLKLFHQDGYQEVDFKEEADVYVINTCTVTNTGDSKSRQMIRKAIRQNPNAIVCVVGCYSQVASEEVIAIEGVKVVLGTQYRQRIVEFVKEYEKTKQPVIHIADVMNLSTFEDLDIDEFTKNTRAFLKIQDGCNNFCTYCIIPYARGRVRSRKPESVLMQAQKLVDHGFVEIVLTGIHTAGYGQDLEGYSFYDLLVDLTTQIKGLKRLRISSIEMSQITHEIIDLIATSPIVVDHLHIPIQAGCDATLKRMNRHYTTSEFADKLNELKTKLPTLSVTTDVIVGFPGETDEEFEMTYRWIQEMHFNQLHVFPYSRRQGTPAAKMKNQIDGKVKHERVKRLMALSTQLQSEFAAQQIGKVIEVLIEERHGDYMIGHASNYLKVHVMLPDSSIGHIYQVMIEKQDGVELIGSVVSEKN